MRIKKYCFSIFVIGIFLILPISSVNAGTFPENSAMFTKADTTSPETGSEPMNLYWKDKTAQEIVNFYFSNGWDIKAPWPASNLAAWLDQSYWGKWLTWNLQLNPFEPNFGVQFRFESTDSVSADLNPAPGVTNSVTNYNSYALIKNNEFYYPVTACFVNLGFPIRRDHFRVWDSGGGTIGSASYDNGAINALITAYSETVGSVEARALLCGSALAGLIASVLSAGTITVAFVIIFISTFIDFLIALATSIIALGTEGGHIIDTSNPWRTRSYVESTWKSQGSDYRSDNYYRQSGTISWQLTGSSHSWDYYSSYMYKYIPPPPPPPGGCISKGTRILLDDGTHTRTIQSLKVGDWVMGYDVLNGEEQPVKITDIQTSTVPELLNINNGLLKLTFYQQPIFAKNTTYTGWFKNPIDLNVGDQIFDPINQNWITIWHLDVENGGNYEVYDIVTDPLNTFIGNGILLDKKCDTC